MEISVLRSLDSKNGVRKKLSICMCMCSCGVNPTLALKLLDFVKIFTKPLFQARVDALKVILKHQPPF